TVKGISQSRSLALAEVTAAKRELGAVPGGEKPAEPGLEGVQLLALQWRFDHLHRQRVYQPAVLVHLVVEVRTGREAAGADIADHLALPEMGAGRGTAAHKV